VAQQLFFAIIGIAGRSRLSSVPHAAAKARFAVFVPAHNEGEDVLPTLASLKAMNYPADFVSIIVIADNCTDGTAATASGAEVDVWVRKDERLRGKGHALAWAFARFDRTRYDAAIVIDADTQADPHLLERFNDVMQTTRLAAYQARYEFAGESYEEPWLHMLSVAAKASENSFVYRSREILCLVNLLQGNGFCLPIEVLERVPWTANSIVEDAEYAIDLCLAGIDCRYIDDVRVISRIATRGVDSAPQKVRWSKGMIFLMQRGVPQLLRQAVCLRQARLAEAALMLLTTSRLTTIYFLAAGVVGALAAPAGARLHLGIMLLIVILGQLFYGLLVICASSDETQSLKNIWLLPRYVLHIASAHLRSLASLRSREWTRTVR
jgi:cellulose synthase/poly-beta-1,6-N-acetylglucosamine synthase-like glycosyltransferase